MIDKKLTQQQLLACQLLAQGGIERTEIAKEVGVSRATLYNWLKKDYFNAEVDRRIREFKDFGEMLITSKLHDAVDTYWTLASTSRNDNARGKALEYFIDRALGKPVDKTELTVNTNEKTNQIEPVILDMEQQQFEQLMNEDNEE